MAERKVRRGVRRSTPWHAHHIAERYGLLTIIALGEGVFGTIASVSAVVEGQGWSTTRRSSSVAGVGLTFGLWWDYFTLPSGLILRAFPRPVLGLGLRPHPGLRRDRGDRRRAARRRLVVEGEAHISVSAAVLAVAVPVLVFCVALFVLYSLPGPDVRSLPHRSVRRHGRLHRRSAWCWPQAGCRAVGVPAHGDAGAAGGGGRLRDHRASARGELAAPRAQLSRARAWAIAFSTRFSDTGTFVRNGWANRLTRSSSSSQPMSSTKSGSRPGGAAAHSSA